MTLAFISEYPEIVPVLDAMDEVEFAPFDLTDDHIGTFRNSIVWGGIEDSSPLAALVKRLRYELAKADIPFDNCSFSPHFTLARHVDFSKGIPPVEIEPVTMTADKITLYRSDRGKSGMIYTEIAYVDAG